MSAWQPIGDVGRVRRDGDVLVLAFTGVQASVDDVPALLGGVRRAWGADEPCPILVQSGEVAWTPKDVRDAITGLIPELFTAAALVVGSPFSRLIMSAFVALRPEGPPVRIFNDEEAARAWLVETTS